MKTRMTDVRCTIHRREQDYGSGKMETHVDRKGYVKSRGSLIQYT